MILIGLVTKPGSIEYTTEYPTGLGKWDYKMFTISHMKGEISYAAFTTFNPDLAIEALNNEIRYTGLEAVKTRCARFTFVAQECSSTEWYPTAVVIPVAPLLVYALLFPLEWNNIDFIPTPIFQPVDTAIPLGTIPHVAILGFVPSIALKVPAPATLLVKPGNPINLGLEMVFGTTAGGTISSIVNNKVTNKSGEQFFSFNPGDTIPLSVEDKMPGLLPDETLDMESITELAICDLRARVETDEAFNEITSKLAEVKPAPVKTSTTIMPTDCMLANISGGIIQILGDTLTYDGLMIDKAGPKTISGTAPSKIEFSELSFLRLDFSKEIAICENRSILSGNGKHYEYSLFPTPWRSMAKTRWAISSFRPAMPWEGLPLPKCTTERPKIRVR